MLSGLLALLLLNTSAVPAAEVHLSTPLPAGAVSKALQMDGDGNIYVAGSLTPEAPKSANDTSDAFAAKIAPDGSTLLYFTVLSGSSWDSATCLLVSADGTAWVAGGTRSADFPVTADSLLSFSGTAADSQGFLARIDSTGNIASATFLGGPGSSVTGMATGGSGEIYLTGQGSSGLPVSSGAPASGPGGFLLKIDPALNQVLLSINGYGGGLVALDRQENIYVAGSAFACAGDALPTLSPAVPSTHVEETPGPAAGCQHQYVAKLDSSGTRVLWATYVTGSYGATTTGIAIDDGGNVILAGTTNSPDYPVTPNAFQPGYPPSAPVPPPSGPAPTGTPFPTGFVTKLKADGTDLLWSTFFGGTYADHITGMVVTPSGEILLSGRTGSSDLPVLSGVPIPCRPQANQVLGFVARLSPDGETAGATQLVYGAPACLYSGCRSTVAGSDFRGWPLAFRPDGTVIVGGLNGSIGVINLMAPTRLACIGDSGDRAQLAAIAPGQLISIFGSDLAAASPYKQPASITGSTEDFGVFLNGIPAPLLYSSTGQINIQVPYEIAGLETVQMRIVNHGIVPALSENRTLGVVERRPNVFLADPVVESPIPGFSPCGGVATPGIAAIALNADGTLNDCSHPAQAGSTVTIFLNGLGAVIPGQVTGAIATAAIPVIPAVDAGIPGIAALTSSTTTTAGSITGVLQVQVQLPARVDAVQALSLAVGGVPLPEQPVIIWTK